MTLVFAGVLGLSAFLVFWIQPLVARMLLPILGGTPAVWNTCVLFFQGMLLAGYLYSHNLARLSFRHQAIVHAIILAVVLTVLPNAPGQWIPPTEASNSIWLLGALLAYIGLPFVFLSSSAPLLQHWFGLSKKTAAKDPYFLYAASNTGSFLALLMFPTVLERAYSMSDQITLWHTIYFALGLGLLTCIALVWKDVGQQVIKSPQQVDSTTTRQIVRWLILAFVPSSLMLGVTTHITTDIASVSFLWVLPLGLYLASFIIAFSKFSEASARVARLLLPLVMVAALVQLFRGGSAPVLLIPVEISIVGCVSVILHCELYQQRPQTTLLTNFYVWVAFGGFLGGLLNGFLAPAVFPGIIEYPLILGLGILIIEWPLVGQAAKIYREQTWNGIRLIEVVVAGALSLVFTALLVGTEDMPTTTIVAVLLLMMFLACMFAVGASKGGRFWIGLGFLVYLGISIAAELDGGIYSGRTFFGAFRVDDAIVEDVEYRRFRHGTTLHGLQAIDSDLELTVQSYYPAIVDHIWPHYDSQGPLSIAVTGLGAGTLACLARKDDRVTFFEIDPVVEEVAREYFTYLEKCPPSTNVVIGDARLRLATIKNNAYDLLILDAFSSDSVPIHLLTSEAAAAYDRVLKEDGLLVFHISNRYIDLRPVLAKLADHYSWSAWEIRTEQRPDRPLERDAVFVVISRDDLVDRLLDGVSGAKPLEATPEFKLWTDDYASLLSVVRYRRQGKSASSD